MHLNNLNAPVLNALIEDVKLLKFQDELCHVLKNISAFLSPVQKLEVNISRSFYDIRLS
jgi:hypothetical protein